MISLVLPAIVVAAIVFALRHRRSPSTGPALPGAADPRAGDLPPAPVIRPPLEVELTGWVDAGLISERQSAAILARTRASQVPPPTAQPAGRRRVPAVAEALGYLGAVLAVVGLVLVLSRSWEDMSTAGRLALSAAAAAVCLVGGFLVREDEDPALARVRWSLWLASTAAFTLFAGVAADGLGAEATETIVLAAAGAAALEGGLLWFGRERPPQQFVALTGGIVTAGAAVAQLASGWPIGAAIWLCGAVVAGAGVRHLTTTPVVAVAVGAVGAVVGAIMMSEDVPGPGLLWFVATACALSALALVPGWAVDRADRTVLGAFGALALLQAVPGTLGYFSRDAALAAGLVTWAAGGGLVVAGHRRVVRLAPAVEALGGLAMIGGAALTGVQWNGFAPVFGLATAVGFLVVGTAPERVRSSILGSIGLLVNVPWAIGRFFPGEGRVPLLIMVTGVLVLVLAVFLARRGTHPGRPRRPRPPPPVPTAR